MDGKQKKYNGQLEINNLIFEAVKNAVARQDHVIDSQDALSNEEAAKIAGGIISKPPIVMGFMNPIPSDLNV